MSLIALCFVFCFFSFYRIQHELEVSTKQAIFVDSSISDTIRTCIVLGNHRAAMRVKTEFKVGFYFILISPVKGRDCLWQLYLRTFQWSTGNVHEMKNFYFEPVEIF